MKPTIVAYDVRQSDFFGNLCAEFGLTKDSLVITERCCTAGHDLTRYPFAVMQVVKPNKSIIFSFFGLMHMFFLAEGLYRGKRRRILSVDGMVRWARNFVERDLPDHTVEHYASLSRLAVALVGIQDAFLSDVVRVAGGGCSKHDKVVVVLDSPSAIDLHLLSEWSLQIIRIGTEPLGLRAMYDTFTSTVGLWRLLAKHA
jgi:hypothetical protein